MITNISDLHASLQSLVSIITGINQNRVILANQGRPPPQGNDLYATYNPVPVRAYGQARKSRALTPAEETGPDGNWQDIAETTITQLEIMLSVNCINEGAKDAALKFHNAQFRHPVRKMLVTNGIGYRYASELRSLTGLYQAGMQPRYQLDVHLFIESGITDTILRAAGFTVEVTDENGNDL